MRKCVCSIFLSWSILFPVHPLSVLPDCHIILLSSQQDRDNTENILNPIGGTDALVYLHGASTWTLHIIASILWTLWLHVQCYKYLSLHVVLDEKPCILKKVTTQVFTKTCIQVHRSMTISELSGRGHFLNIFWQAQSIKRGVSLLQRASSEAFICITFILVKDFFRHCLDTDIVFVAYFYKSSWYPNLKLYQILSWIAL